MKKIKMQLFGSFKLDSGTAVLGEENFRANKPIRLLIYMLMNREHTLTQFQLIELFWGSDTKKPEGALKTLMYRIRNELKVLGDEIFICTCPGGYQWNPEIEIESDYEQFEQMASQLRKTVDSEKQETLCRKIISSYRGNVSAKVATEPWLLPKVTRYQSVYTDTVNRLCEILREKGAWEEIERICNESMHVDTLNEDTHCLLLTALYGQKKYGLALAQYEKAKKLFYENMGIPVPKKLQQTFQAMMAEAGEKLTDIGRLLEEAREPEKPVGAFFCDYQIFRQIYQMEVRRVERLGIAEFIALFTLRRSNDIWRMSGIDHGLLEGMDILEHAINMSLRVGDVASKYSPTQIIVLLPVCNYEDGMKVAERVQKKFQSRIRNRKLELGYELAELSASRA